MSLKDRYVVCRNRRVLDGDRYVTRGGAQSMADRMNQAAGRDIYHVHQESELDANGCGPCLDHLHQWALPALTASAADNPRLAALLAEIEHGKQNGG